MASEELLNALSTAVFAGDVQLVQSLLTQHPELIRIYWGTGTWLHKAARATEPMVRLLIDLGCDVNAETPFESRETPLSDAVGSGNPQIIRTLLEAGADPNRCRIVLLAVAGDKPSLEIIKLLEKHGAKLDAEFKNEFNGQQINALSMAEAGGKQDVAQYLRTRGVQLPAQLVPQPPEKSVSNDVLEYFHDRVGPVNSKSLIEIVPTDPATAVHVVPAAGARKHLTLFTTGMSSRPLTIPDEDEPVFAEVFIELPGNWHYHKITDAKFGWPVHWLRSMAKNPHQNGGHLGGPAIIVANGDPPEPIAPGIRFDSMLLVTDRTIPTFDGKRLHLYRMLPLYPEERELEATEGIGALLRQFDRLGIPFVVNLDRPNAGVSPL